MMESNNKKATKLHKTEIALGKLKAKLSCDWMLYWLFMPVLAMVFILLNHYSHNINLTLMEMNIMFLLFYFMNLIAAIFTLKNLHKIFWLLDVLEISIIIIIYDTVSKEITSIGGFFKSICSLWIVLVIPALVYFVVVCLRVIQWSQENWEEIKKIRQDERKKVIEGQKAMRVRVQEIKFRLQSYSEAAQTHENALKREAGLRRQEQDHKAEQEEHDAEIAHQKQVNANKREEEEEERKKEAVHLAHLRDIEREQKESEKKAEITKNIGKISTVKLGQSQSLCKPPNWCKIRLLSLEVLSWQEKMKAHKKRQ